MNLQGWIFNFNPCMKHLFIFIVITVFIFGCANDNPANNIAEKKLSPEEDTLAQRWKIVYTAIDSICQGDLVLRCGNDMVSYSLRDFSQAEKIYSHTGIALRTDSGMYIFHNMAGDLNPDEVMKMERADSFLTPVINTAVGIYRYDLSEKEISGLKTIVMEHYKNKLPFDMSFDLSTDDKMYCAEMIAKAVEKATGKRITFSKSQVNDELRNKYLKMALQKNIIPSATSADQREYLAIDNLYLNPHCRQVYKHIFEDIRVPVRIPSPENDLH